MDWIDTEDKLPDPTWQIVWVTDGHFITLARWIDDPKGWYGPDFMMEDPDDEDKEIPVEEWQKKPHFVFLKDDVIFIGDQEGFGPFGAEVTHWMPLPHPPKE